MKDIATYKKALTEELSELEEELKAIGIHDPKNPSDWVAVPEGVNVSEPDPNSAADRVEEWGERRSAVAILESRYNNVVRALKKIEEGNYGICEIGDEEIEEDRLAANAAARTCKTHMNEEDTLPR